MINRPTDLTHANERRLAELSLFLDYQIHAARAVLIDAFQVSEAKADFLLTTACLRYLAGTALSAKDPQGFKETIAEILECETGRQDGGHA